MDDAEPREGIAGFLHTVPLFAGLTTELLNELAVVTQQACLPGGTWLFHEGASSDCLYVVRSGRLRAVHEGLDGEEILRVFGPRDVVGELAFLTESPRAASTRAVRDSELISLSKDHLLELMHRDQAFTLALLRLLGRRLQLSGAAPPPPRRSPTVVAVVDLTGRAKLPELVAQIESHGPKTKVLEPGTGPVGQRGRAIDETEAQGGRVVLLASHDAEPEWRSFCVRQADRILAVADAAATPDATAGRLMGCDLALLGRGRDPHPWLETLRPRCWSWVEDDWGRATRRLLDASVSLVLSGGGARGLAHLGVLSALADAGVVVDQVGGCSMGSFIGAMLAMGWDCQRITAACREELASGKTFRDYTVPRVSLIKARRAQSMLYRLFGERHIEELPIPFFAVSADLSTGELVVHRTGLVRDAVGASMSLPGLAPPQRSAGRLLVDGGVLDNLPVDVPLEREQTLVIAVDVMRRYQEADETAPLPPLLETISRASTLGSLNRTEENRARADVLITPDVADIGLLDFAAIERAIEAGISAGRSALAGTAIPGS